MLMNPPANTPELRRALDQEIEKRFGQFGGVERRGGLPVSDIPLELEWRASGDPQRDGQMVVKGYAAVFNRLSMDLGGFREKIVPGAFDNALAADPHVLLLWDHASSLILGSTRATDPESLELRSDQNGLRFFSRVVPTTYASDLRALMDAGIVRQASFGFTVERDSWTIDDKENVTRTIIEISSLFDVTVTAMGAYPQTASSLVRQRAYDFATTTGRLSDQTEAEGDVAPVEGNAEVIPSHPGGDQEEREAALLAMRSRLDELKSDIARR
jgi:HK97 family phage prohead protease